MSQRVGAPQVGIQTCVEMLESRLLLSASFGVEAGPPAWGWEGSPVVFRGTFQEDATDYEPGTWDLTALTSQLIDPGSRYDTRLAIDGHRVAFVGRSSSEVYYWGPELEAPRQIERTMTDSAGTLSLQGNYLVFPNSSNASLSIVDLTTWETTIVGIRTESYAFNGDMLVAIQTNYQSSGNNAIVQYDLATGQESVLYSHWHRLTGLKSDGRLVTWGQFQGTQTIGNLWVYDTQGDVEPRIFLSSANTTQARLHVVADGNIAWSAWDGFETSVLRHAYDAQQTDLIAKGAFYIGGLRISEHMMVWQQEQSGVLRLMQHRDGQTSEIFSHTSSYTLSLSGHHVAWTYAPAGQTGTALFMYDALLDESWQVTSGQLNSSAPKNSGPNVIFFERNPDAWYYYEINVALAPTIEPVYGFEWDFGDGNTASGTLEPAHTYADNGVYDVTLTVTNLSSGASASGTTSAIIENVDPVATITGAGQAAFEGSPVTLGSTVYDPGVLDTFTYAWTVTRDGELYAGGSDAEFTFTPDDDGLYLVTLIVTDNDGGIGSDQVEIHVANVAPTVAIEPELLFYERAYEGSPVTFRSEVTDPGVSDTHTYAWSVTVDGQIVATGTGESLTFTPVNDGFYEVSLVVTDNAGDTGEASYLLRVWNVAPVAWIVEAPQEGFVGDSLLFVGDAQDPGVEDVLTFTWAAWLDGQVVATGEGQSFAFVPALAGEYQVVLTVTDCAGASGMAAAMLSVAVAEADLDVAISGPAIAVRNQHVTLQAMVIEGAADGVTMSWVVRDASGQIVASGGEASIDLSLASEGLHTVELTATGSAGQVATATHELEISAAMIVDGVFYAGGTDGADRVVVSQIRKTGQIVFSMNGRQIVLDSVDRIVVFGGDGDDRIAVTGKFDTAVEFYGQGGNNFIVGGDGNDILVGGSGDDTIIASGGDNIIIGGGGDDTIISGGGNDLIITGSTIYDDDPEALRLLLAIWTSSDLSYEELIHALTYGTGLDGEILLNDDTVFFDDGVNMVIAPRGENWVWYSDSDKVVG